MCITVYETKIKVKLENVYSTYPMLIGYFSLLLVIFTLAFLKICYLICTIYYLQLRTIYKLGVLLFYRD